jgi:hypothetical protein
MIVKRGEDAERSEIEINNVYDNTISLSDIVFNLDNKGNFL